MSIFSSVLFFHLAPGALQIASEFAAEENIEMFVATRVRMLDVANRLDAAKMFAVACAIAAEHDDAAAIVTARALQPVALMVVSMKKTPNAEHATPNAQSKTLRLFASINYQLSTINLPV